MLDENRLKNKLMVAFSEEEEYLDSAAAKERVAQRIAKAIIEEIKELKIIYTSGLTAPSGPVTGTLNHEVQ